MDASVTPAPTMTEAPPTPAIDMETTPEFQAFKANTLAEVAAYLNDNWGIKNAEVVMVPELTFPDRANRRAYASVASGKSFRDSEGKVVTNPATGQPMNYTVWRKVDRPTPTPEPAIEDTKPDVAPAPEVA